MSLESIFRLSLIMNMVDNLTGPMSSVQSSVGGSVSKLQSFEAGLGSMVKTGAAMTAVGSQIVDAVLAPVTATYATQRAIGELSSLGIKDLGAVENAARSFSDTWAGTTKTDFIGAAYDIKSGIASLSDEGVAEFTTLAALTAKATKSNAAEMTSLFATGYGIYKSYYSDLSDLEFGEIFSAGISRSVQQFKTTGSGMAQAIQTLGASATTAQVPLEEQLSILGMLQATMGGSEAGTKYKAFLRSAAKGGKELGLNFMDANNQLLAMPEIMDILRGKFGDTMDAAEKMELQKAFGDTEAVALIDLMYSKTGELQRNIVDLYGTMGQGTGIAQGMASAINDMQPDQYAVLEQQMQNVKETMGKSLLPTISEVIKTVSGGVKNFGQWAESHQNLVKVIMLVVLGLGGFLIVGGSLLALIGGIGLVVTKAIGVFNMLKTGFLLAKGALVPLIGSVWSFTAALLANPVTWVVIGIVALIAAIALLYNKCEGFRNAVNAILNFFKEKLGAALSFVKSIFQGIGNVVGTVMNAAKNTVAEKLNNMKTAYETHGGGIRGVAAAAIEGVKGIHTAGLTFLDNLTGGKLTAIKNKFLEKLGPIKDIAGNVLDAAKSTVSEKLNNMKTAYETHGGGIRGAAAAAIEGVKGVYTAGFTFLDNLTGGKLTAIKDKFFSSVTAIRDGIGAKISEIGAKFSQGIETIKSNISGAITWFFDSGKKVITTFANGIKSAISSAVDAVKGVLQKIRNMLPFSDAKVGPLSSLTLSGQRTMTTIAGGIDDAGNEPVRAVERNFDKIDLSLKRAPVKKVQIQPVIAPASDPSGSSNSTNKEERPIVIERLYIQTDISKMKELPQLFRLVREIEDQANSNGIDTEEMEPIRT